MPLDQLAATLVRKFTDPNDPDNRLKRPVKTHCLNCEGTYIRTVQILVDPGFCSDACRQEYIAKTERLAQELQADAERRLIAAIFGEEIN
jgi:hypothetical protein